MIKNRFRTVVAVLITIAVMLNSCAIVAMAGGVDVSVSDVSKALYISFGRSARAQEYGFEPTYNFGEQNGTYMEKYSYYRTYDEDYMGSPVPMTGLYMQNGADDAGNNKAYFTPLSVSNVYNATYTENDRMHFSAYIKLLYGNVSAVNFLPDSIGASIIPPVSLKAVSKNKWTRVDIYYQPKVTYEYTVTKNGVTESCSDSTTQLISVKNSSRTNNATFWNAVLPACGKTYDSSATYNLTKVVFGVTATYIDGLLVSEDSYTSTASNAFYGFSDVKPARLTIQGGDASVGFGIAVSNYSFGKSENFDKSAVSFGRAYVNGSELYSIDKSTRTISLNGKVTPSDIKVPAGCTAAVYKGESADDTTPYTKVADGDVIEEGNIISVADENYNLTYYNVASSIVTSNHKFVGGAAEAKDPSYRFKFADAYGIGGKSADDASMLFDYDYTSADPYTEYALGMSSSELMSYKGYIKVGMNVYPTAEMSGIAVRLATNKSMDVAGTIAVSDMEINRWNRVESIIKVNGGSKSVVQTYLNGELIKENESNFCSNVSGTNFTNFRIGMYVPDAKRANFAPIYFDDIHTYFSNSKPEIYSLPQVPQCVTGDYVSNVTSEHDGVRVLSKEGKLRNESEKIEASDTIVAEKEYTSIDRVYAYGTPFEPKIVVDNVIDGVCYQGAPIVAKAYLGRSCNVYIAEKDADGKEIGVAMGDGQATYVPQTIGNTVKIIVADTKNLAPFIAPVELTVGEYSEDITYTDLGDSVDFIPDKMRNYLNDTYDSCDKYASATEAMDKPLPTTLAWECDIDDVERYEVAISEHSDMSDAWVVDAKTNSCDVYNLKIDTRYYWRATAILSDGTRYFGKTCGEFGTIESAPRLLYIDGVVNARDIGGWKISDTKRVKQGMIFRTAKPDTATSALITSKGIQTMTEQLGIKSEIDFRTDTHHPYTIPSVYPNINYYRCAFATASFDNKPAIIDIFSKLADEDNYPVNYHCLAGADRTGLITYLVNGVLGVSREDLLRDYMLTNFTNNGQWRPISGISNYIDLLDNYRGDTYQQKVYGYLVNEIGVNPEHLDKLIDIMTEDIPQ